MIPQCVKIQSKLTILSAPQPQTRNELATSKPLPIVQPSGLKDPRSGLENATGKPKLLPSARTTASGIRSISYVLPCKPFDSKWGGGYSGSSDNDSFDADSLVKLSRTYVP
ncbi:MAG: hypothetical protein EZS28_007835 [Streblomastix strix]|uniref:Uncharacterized protein n=1 Tax=Streblomastix strix TaxID=222440 RepID=A0A5J4WNV3_9EUKA|nr:MAG: hypothetical protein EZS28_007835 [Streblomastix strix]